MRKHLLAVALLMVMLAGCGNWVSPKRVAVSSDATFKIPIGEIKGGAILGDTLEAFLNPDVMAMAFNSDGSQNMNVYQYTGNKTDGNDESLTYLIQYPVAKFSQDVGSLLGDIDFSSATSDDSAGDSAGEDLSSFTIPEMSEKQTVDIIDLEEMKQSFLDSVTEDLQNAGYEVTVKEPGTSDYREITEGFESNIIDVEVEHAESVVYSAGTSIAVDVSRKNYNSMSPDFSVQLKALITDWYNEPIPGCETEWTEMNYGGRLLIPFEGEKPSRIKIVVRGRAKGGMGPEYDDYWHLYYVDISLFNFSIDKVTGVTATAEELGVEIDPINERQDVSEISDYFSDIVIKNGFMTIKAEQPDGWTNITCSAPISFWGAGIPESEAKTLEEAADKAGYILNSKKDLAGIELDFTSETDKDLIFNGNVEVVLTNSTIDFTKTAAGSKIKAVIDLEVEDLTEATVPCGEGSMFREQLGDLDIVRQEADDIFGNMVKSVTFSEKIHGEDGTELRDGNGYGFTFTVNNTLPEGNNLPFKIVSDFLSFDSDRSVNKDGSAVEVLPANKDGKPTEVTLTNYGTVDFAKPAEGESNYVDLRIVLPDDSFKLTNVKSNTIYSFTVSNVNPVFDWDKAEINFDEPLAKDSVELSGFDLSEIFESFGLNDAELPQIDAYVFVQKSDEDFLKDATLSGKIDLSYTSNKGETVNQNLFKGNDGKIANPDDIVWPKKGEPFTADIEKLPYLTKVPFTQLLEDDAEDLALDYDISLQDTGSSGILTVYSSALGDSDSQSISVDIAIKLPLNLSIPNSIEIDLMEEIDSEYNNKPDEDLLQRTQPADEFADGDDGSMTGGGDDDSDAEMSVADILSHVDFFALNISLKNKVVIVKNKDDANAPLMKIVIKDSNILNANNEPFVKEIAIPSEGTAVIKFEGDEIDRILEAPVFHPSIKLFIGSDNSSISINDAVLSSNKSSEESLLSVNLIFELKLNGSNPFIIPLGAGEGNGGI